MEKNTELLKNLIVPNLYKRYSSILALSDIPLSLIDKKGEVLLELIPSPAFCTYVCQYNKGYVCEDYINQIENEKEGLFTCKYGLENIIIPVTLDDEIVGYISGIQSFLESNKYKKYLIDINSLLTENLTDISFIAKMISSIGSIDSEKIKVQQHLGTQISKNISLDLFENIKNPNQDIQRLSLEKEILEKKIIDLESKNISLAINPHFLFNTLNCIARIAYFEKSDKTEELIYCLSDLLRYNLKQNDQLHTLDAEINNIEKYLYIQQSRYKDRLDYEIEIPDNFKSYKIANMIIQPIVENAVIHGIASKRDGGKVKIYADKKDNDLRIYIADNGNGFPKEVLDKLKDSNDNSGLGFRNTDQRLKEYYGKDYGLNIIKSDYSGSTVKITIPI